ncbi:MAG: ribosome biogenesis/translation initiation ATPase RLI [Candidatus Thermoplasmatota archaeon]
MRIAVLIEDKCQSDRCSYECINYCPMVRTGNETIVKTEDAVKISEELCEGCGICVDKCPFDAIKMVNLPEELDTDLIHQFGENSFRLYRLPLPEEGLVTGLLGANGIGKTTAIRMLSGEITPNLGNYEEDASWERVIEKYSGTALGNYFRSLAEGELETALKPQYVDKIPAHYSGKVEDLLSRIGDDYERWVETLEIENTLDSKLTNLSGGELQRVAIAATSTKEADVYFYDEPSSYLDIRQRLQVAEAIKEKSEDSRVMVIEHDLAVLDFLADNVHLLYGSKGAYGIVSHPKGVRVAINSYLRGFIDEENIRFRDTEITFEERAPKPDWHSKPIVEYDTLVKEWDSFVLETEEGEIPEGEVIGVVGPNATGKTTFVKMLADVIEPTDGEIKKDITVSYKPQYIKPDFQGRVIDLYRTEIGDRLDEGFFRSNVLTPLDLDDLYEREVPNLSGGELQRTVLALSLGRKADLYLIDEPSAYLDAGRRMTAAKVIRRYMEKIKKGGMIVDHDVYFIDYVSDMIMNFSGVPGKRGKGEGPYDMRKGMNNFLKEVNITFRRDEQTHRPRVNKLDSRLDKKQKSEGEYYYIG